MVESTPKRASKASTSAKPAVGEKAPATRKTSAAPAAGKVSAAKPKPAATPRVKKIKPTEDLRQRMIIETSYFLSERRRADAGELDDWLFAERLVDTLIAELK